MPVTRAGVENRNFAQLTLEVAGYEKVSVALKRFAADIRDWRPFFRDELAPKVFADFQRNFQTEGGLVGGWPPLSPAYAAWKREREGLDFEGGGILLRTHRLRRSLEWVGGQPGAEGVFRTPTERSVELGTSVPYAVYHQSPRPRRKIPLRRIVFLASSETYGRLLHRWAVRTAKEAQLPVTNLAVSRFA